MTESPSSRSNLTKVLFTLHIVLCLYNSVLLGCIYPCLDQLLRRDFSLRRGQRSPGHCPLCRGCTGWRQRRGSSSHRLFLPPSSLPRPVLYGRARKLCVYIEWTTWWWLEAEELKQRAATCSYEGWINWTDEKKSKNLWRQEKEMEF